MTVATTPARRRLTIRGAAGAGAGRGSHHQSVRGGLFVRAVLLALCLLWLVPTVGLLISSFRTRTEVVNSGWWTTLASPLEFTQWTVANYQQVLGNSGMANSFLNTIVLTIPATVLPIVVAAFAGYAFSWMQFRGRNTMFLVIVSLLVVPVHAAFIPLIRGFGALGLTGTFTSVWLAHTAFGLPLAVYILRNYMGGLPKEVIESARVDGATHFQTFWRLALPLSAPAIAAYAIFQFLWVWNDYLVALVFLGGTRDVEVMTINLAQLVGQHGHDWHLLTAGAFVTMAVPLAVFLTLQRFFVRGMTAGSIKG